MFFAIFIFLIMVALLVHELSHGKAMRKYGIEVPEAGLGLPIPYLPSLAIRLSNDFTFRIHLFLLGAYVSPKNEKRIKNLSYRERAHIYGAGIMANIIMGLAMIILLMVVDMIKRPEGIAHDCLMIALCSALILVFWKFGGKISAYVLPLLSPAMMGYLIWSVFSHGAKESLMGPIGIFTLGYGFSNPYQVLIYGAIVSIGLALTNLLPFWPMDGGRILTDFFKDRFCLGEGFEKGVSTAGLILTVALVILVFFSDITRLLS